MKELRSRPLMNLSPDSVKAMLKEEGFFDAADNKRGRGLQHDYKSIEWNGAKLVIDYATGLMWQQGGSKERIDFTDAQKYIAQLNSENLAGYSDWRLPTLEELMSLMEPKKKKNGNLYIDPAFDKNQCWIWTADQAASGGAWFVTFYGGYCSHVLVPHDTYVRAVRSGQLGC